MTEYKDQAASQASAGFFGTTIRFYDPSLDAGRSTWIDPPNGVASGDNNRPCVGRGDVLQRRLGGQYALDVVQPHAELAQRAHEALGRPLRSRTVGSPTRSARPRAARRRRRRSATCAPRAPSVLRAGRSSCLHCEASTRWRVKDVMKQPAAHLRGVRSRRWSPTSRCPRTGFRSLAAPAFGQPRLPSGGAVPQWEPRPAYQLRPTGDPLSGR